MRYWKICLMLFSVVFVTKIVNGTHIVGGEFELEERTNGNYNIHLNLYFDQVNGNPGAIDALITVAIFRRSDDQRIEQLQIPLVTDSIVDYENPDCAVTDLAVRLLRYSLVDFTFQSSYNDLGGYYIVYDRCCRNNAIMNIANPGAVGMLFYNEFPPIYQMNGSLTGYSSPVFNIVRTRYACLNEYFYMDFGATDADGDSLVFSMATPLIGNSFSGGPVVTNYLSGAWQNKVTWLAGFDSADAIHGAPQLHVDSTTGLLEIIASQVGLHVFSVKCEEFRNGVKIGEIRRDFQILVDICDPNSPPSVRMEDEGGIGFYTEGDTVFIANDGNRCFEFFITDDQDPRNNERVSVSIEPKNFIPLEEIGLNNTSGIVGGPGDTLAGIKMCWPECEFILNEPYKIDVIVADDGCILPKKDTIEVTLIVEPEVNNAPTLDLSIPGIPGFYMEGDTILIHGDTPACLDLFTSDSTDTRLVELITFSFDADNFFPSSGFGFAPDTGTVTDDTLNAQLCWPNCQFDSSKVYQFDVIVTDNGCIQPKSDTMSVMILPYPNLGPTLNMKNQEGGGFYQEGDTIYIPKDQAQCFDMYITDDLDNRDAENMTVLLDPINFTPSVGFGLNTNFGTVGGIGDTLTSINFCWPECEYSLGSAYQLNVIVYDESCLEPIYDTLELLVVVEPNNPAALYYEIDGNLDSTDITMDINVDTMINIQFFGLDMDSLDVLNLEGFPQGFSFTDAGMQFQNATGIGGRVESPFSWQPDCAVFNELGSEFEMFFVVRDNDCYTSNDHDSVMVRFTLNEGVREPESFLPANIFTPNNDGVNDYFKMPLLPVASCTDDFISVEIYNRWGKRVFYTEEPDFMWDGEDLPDGAYYFLALYTKTTYKGHLSIAR